MLGGLSTLRDFEYSNAHARVDGFLHVQRMQGRLYFWPEPVHLAILVFIYSLRSAGIGPGSMDREVRWVGRSLYDLRDFPQSARENLGYLSYEVQEGQTPTSAFLVSVAWGRARTFP